MGLRDELVRRIDKKRKEINDLDNRLKAATSYIQALEDTLKLIPTGEEEVSQVVAKSHAKADEVLREGSKPARVREILLKSAQPMHIIKLLEAMGEKTDLEERAA